MKLNRIIKLFFFGVILFIKVSGWGVDLEIAGAIEEVYDDNTNNAGNKNDREDDFITNLILSAGLSHQGKRKNFDLFGNIYQSLYAFNQENNYNSQDLDLLFSYNLTANDIFSLSNVFQHYPEAKSFNDTFDRAGSQNDYIYNTCDFKYSHFFIKQFSFNFWYTNQVNRYLEGDNNDSYLHSPGARINLSLTSKHILSGYYDYTYRDIKSVSIIKENEFVGQYKLFFTNQLYSILSAGVNYIKIEDEELERFPQFSFILGNDFTERIHIHFLVSKKVSSNMNNSDLYDSLYSQFVFNLKLMKRMGFNFTAFYGKGEYLNLDETYKLVGMETALEYELTEHLLIDIKYKTIIKDIKRNQIAFAISARY